MTHEDDVRDNELLADGRIADLLAIYEPVILARCIARLHGSLDAEDVAQQVRLRLWREFRAGKRYSVPFRVVVHQVIGWTIQDYFQDRPSELPLDDDWDAVAVDDVEGEVVGAAFLRSVLDRLEGRVREVLELRYWYGMEHDQIAQELEITRNNVDQRLHQGHKQIREYLLV